MGYVQRVQFTTTATWVAEGTLPGDLGEGFGTQRLHIEGSQVVFGSSRVIKMDIGSETLDFFPELDTSKQYRVTIEEVTA